MSPPLQHGEARSRQREILCDKFPVGEAESENGHIILNFMLLYGL